MSDTLLIARKMRTADSPAQIHFVLTCYIEGLRLYSLASLLPAGVTALPLQGEDDIQSRCALLSRELSARHSSERTSQQQALLDQASLIFAAAHIRLKALIGAPAAAAETRRPPVDDNESGFNIHLYAGAWLALDTK